MSAATRDATAEAAVLPARLAELTFATGSQVRERIDAALTQLNAGAMAFGFMSREGAYFSSADQLVAMMLTSVDEVRAAATELCQALDELVSDDDYADWVESHTELADWGWTRETIIGLRKDGRARR